MDTLMQVVRDDPVAPRQLNADVPVDLETICLKCLAKESCKRYDSAQALAEDLGRYRRGEPILARPVGRVERLWRWSRRNPAVAGLMLLVLAVLSAGLAGVSWQWLRADGQRQQAEAARTKADEQRQQAELARTKADRERETARWEAYKASINSASAALQVGNAALLELALANAPEEHRGWEWRYLHGKLDNSTRLLVKESVSIAVSAQGDRIATSMPDGSVHVWSHPGGDLITRIPGPKQRLVHLTFSPDGQYLAASTTTDLILWNMETRQKTILAPITPRSRFAFSPDSRFLALGNETKKNFNFGISAPASWPNSSRYPNGNSWTSTSVPTADTS